MRRFLFTIVFLTAVSSFVVGCGGSAKKENTHVVSVEDYETGTFTVGAGEGEVEGLLGNVTQDEIERVFSNNRNAMLRCYEDAVFDVEELEGEIRFEIEVASDGTVNHAFISSGDLGSVDTESCMLRLVNGFEFKRVPGGVAVIYYPLELRAPYAHPPFASLDDGKLSAVVDEHRAEIDSCLGGNSGVHMTLYIGTGGVVLSAGGSADTLEAFGTVSCISNAARAWRFPDPGQKLVKAAVDF